VVERTAIARGPIVPAPPEALLGGWAVSARRSPAPLVLADFSPMTKVAVRAAPSGPAAERVGVPFGAASRQSWAVGDRQLSVLVVGSGPGEWLVLAPPGMQEQVVGRLAAEVTTSPGELVTVVDLTHGRALIRLTGVRSPDVLAKESAVHLGDEVCPDGTALRTSVAGLATDLIRADRGGVASYLMHCERSSGQYLFDSLLDAGAEFGIDIDGFVVTDAQES